MKIIPNEKIIYIKILNYYKLKYTNKQYELCSIYGYKMGVLTKKEYNNLLRDNIITIVSKEEYESNI